MLNTSFNCILLELWLKAMKYIDYDLLDCFTTITLKKECGLIKAKQNVNIILLILYYCVLIVPLNSNLEDAAHVLPYMGCLQVMSTLT